MITWTRLARTAPALLALAASPALAVTIDDFSAGPTSVQVALGESGKGSSQTGLPAAQVIGGVRQFGFGVLKKFGTNPPAGADVTAAVDTAAGGMFRYDADPDLTAVNFGLLYDGSDTATPALNADLTADGHDALALDFAYADFASGEGFLDIAIRSAGGGQLGDYLRVPDSATPFTLFVPFNPTGTPYNNTLDARHVTSIQIGSANGNLFGSFALTGIRTATVPEPAALGVLAAAAGATLLGRRRMR